MNRVLALCVLLVMCVVLNAQAYISPPSSALGRLSTLGGGDALNENFWADSEEVYNFPGSLTNYSDILTISFGPAGEGYTTGSAGVTLSKSEANAGTFYLGLFSNPTPDAFGNECNNTTLGYAYPFSFGTVGLMFNRQAFSNTDGAGVESSNSWNTFSAGIDYDLNEDTNIDASLMVRTAGDDTGGFGVMARAFHGRHEDVTLIPVVQFSSMEGPLKLTDTRIGLGVGFAYTINESNDLVIGVNWQNRTIKNESAGSFFYADSVEVVANSETGIMVLPGFYIGTQHEFTDWLELRAGASKNWVKTDPDGTAESSDFPFSFSSAPASRSATGRSTWA